MKRAEIGQYNAMSRHASWRVGEDYSSYCRRGAYRGGCMPTSVLSTSALLFDKHQFSLLLWGTHGFVVYRTKMPWLGMMLALSPGMAT
jgi:hypothetical protein